MLGAFMLSGAAFCRGSRTIRAQEFRNLARLEMKSCTCRGATHIWAAAGATASKKVPGQNLAPCSGVPATPE